MDIVDISIKLVSAIFKFLGFSEKASEMAGKFKFNRYSYLHPHFEIKELLLSNITNQIYPNDDFINYPHVLSQNYYSNDGCEVEVICSVNGEIRTVVCPYRMVINYAAKPEVKIRVDYSKYEEWKLSGPLRDYTESIIKDFFNVKGQKEDGPVLRVKSLSECGSEWICRLQKTTYYESIRTNQTLDANLDDGTVIEDSMRMHDVDDEKQLKNFDESIMANGIGVSAVVCVCGKGRKGHRYFLKPRKSSTGVFSNMMGTVSGVIEPPEDINIFKDIYLEDYLKKEVIREFQEETGLPVEMINSVHPLAFTRELIRGGKPQFFFLIALPGNAAKIIKKSFKKSLDGNKEFNDRVSSRIRNFSLSPETFFNFLLAYNYMEQKTRRDDPSKLVVNLCD
ncbi:MAG: NUDIX hydrolase [Bacteroidales bacterium]|nr:NUDIX hydrolase [Candidatus Cacconaster merdequi]